MFLFVYLIFAFNVSFVYLIFACIVSFDTAFAVCIVIFAFIELLLLVIRFSGVIDPCNLFR